MCTPGKSAMVTTQSQTSHNNSVKVFFPTSKRREKHLQSNLEGGEVGCFFTSLAIYLSVIVSPYIGAAKKGSIFLLCLTGAYNKVPDML